MEALVHDESSIVNKTVVVDSQEHVHINISVTSSDENAAVVLLFILLSLGSLILLKGFALLVIFIGVGSSTIVRSHGTALLVFFLFDLLRIITFFDISHFEVLESNVFQAFFRVYTDIEELVVLENSDTELGELFLDLVLDLLILKSIRVDVRKVGITSILNFQVASSLRNSQNDLLRSNASGNETLDAAVSMEGSTVNNAVLDLSPISEHIDKVAANLQVLVKLWIIDGQNLISPVDFGKSHNTSGFVLRLKFIEGVVLQAHSEDQSIVRDDRIIVQNDVLIMLVDVNHTTVDNSDSRLEH